MQPAPDPAGAPPVFGAESSTPAAPPAPVPPWAGPPVAGAAPGWEHLYANGQACGSPPVGAPLPTRPSVMKPRDLAQEVINAAFDRRHDDVQRYVARLVILASARVEPPQEDPPPVHRTSLEPSD